MKGRTQETRLGTRLSREIFHILKSRNGFISALPLIWTLKQTPIEPSSRAARSGMLEILKWISDLKMSTNGPFKKPNRQWDAESTYFSICNVK